MRFCRTPLSFKNEKLNKLIKKKMLRYNHKKKSVL